MAKGFPENQAWLFLGAGCQAAGRLSRLFLFLDGFGRLDSHRLLWPLVDPELENIRPRVVADHVQVVFSADNLSVIDFGDQNCLALHIRPSQEISEWIDDAASAARHNLIRIFPERRGIIGGKIPPPVELCTTTQSSVLRRQCGALKPPRNPARPRWARNKFQSPSNTWPRASTASNFRSR